MSFSRSLAVAYTYTIDSHNVGDVVSYTDRDLRASCKRPFDISQFGDSGMGRTLINANTWKPVHIHPIKRQSVRMK
uniref:Uncharacterized protein n=1 Tax=Glossina palpalis gambiensis TaxID=67801 RepID=A0A1B0BE45_9MUSC